MTEMIVPGTYIDVRAEGLISAGRIATGIVGVVGTAASGPLNTPITLAGFAEAREVFGLPDPFASPNDGEHPLTLTRALELIYGNGASGVVAVRVAGASASSASVAVLDAANRTVATLSARSPGTAGNNLRLQVVAASEPCRIERELYTGGFDRLTYPRVVPSAQNQIRVTRGQSRRTDVLTIVYRRTVLEERVSPGPGGRFLLANRPVAVDAARVPRPRARCQRGRGARIWARQHLARRGRPARPQGTAHRE